MLIVSGHLALELLLEQQRDIKKRKGNMEKNIQEGNFLQRPQAWIAVFNNRQKLYGKDQNKIYLEDGQEFQIELYNPTSTSYLSKIYINGELLSTSGLVLKPGQRYFLDRHLDAKKKLIFSTYDVEDTKEVKKAIKKNGVISIEFYPSITPINRSKLSGSTWISSYPSTNTPYFPSDPVNPIINPIIFGGSTVNNIFTTSATTSSSSGGNTSYPTSNLSNHFVAGSLSTSIKTGRIERGGKSDQYFGTDYGNYSVFKSYESIYKILPRSSKPIEVNEVREYCTGCGTRTKKKSWKFCPLCGGNLE